MLTMNKFGTQSPSASHSIPAFLATERNDVMNRFLEKFILRICPPARYSSIQVADALGFHVDDIPVLVKEGFLTPLGDPKNNSIKYFSNSDVIAFGADHNKLNEAQAILYKRNREKIS